MSDLETRSYRHGFLQFCQNLHANHLTQPALATLKRHPQVNLSLLLFCCWFACTGQGRLRQKDIRLLRKTIAAWHDKIVQPLQQMQSSLILLKSELQQTLATAERIERQLLIDTLEAATNKKQKDLQRLKNALRNIKGYFDYLHTPLSEGDRHAVYTLLQTLFPDTTTQQMQAWYKSNEIARNAAAQLHLDF